MHAAAVVVAAGQGVRMRGPETATAGPGERPAVVKQFIPVLGRPLVLFALDAILHCEGIGSTVLVVPASTVTWARETLLEQMRPAKPVEVVAGGPTRQASVFEGLLALERRGGAPEYVVVHDGVRPVVDGPLVSRVLEAAQERGAATAGVPVRETVKEVDEAGRVCATLDRSRLWSIQTPQAFSFTLLIRAHRNALELGLDATDDCALVEALGHPVWVVAGSGTNIKVTTPEDMQAVEALLSIRSTREGAAGER